MKITHMHKMARVLAVQCKIQFYSLGHYLWFRYTDQ